MYYHLITWLLAQGILFDLILWMLLALWVLMYAVMHLINFSFLVVLFGFMQLETYKLSWSLQRGAFPLYPTQNGLIFMPLTFELPLSPQLQEVDIVLHKATDEILSIELKSRANFSNRIVYNSGMQDLQRWLFRSIKLCFMIWYELGNQRKNEHANASFYVFMFSLTWSSIIYFFGGIVLWLCQHESCQALVLAKVKCLPC